MTALLVFSIVMTVVAFYVAFVSRDPLFKVRRVSAFYILLVLTLIAAYGFYQERTAGARLGAFVDPYPHTSQIIWVPAAGTGGRYWIFKTSDSNETVAAFYRDFAQREGWTIEEDDGHNISLRKDTRCLNLTISRTQSAGKTTIIYSLRENCQLD